VNIPRYPLNVRLAARPDLLLRSLGRKNLSRLPGIKTRSLSYQTLVIISIVCVSCHRPFLPGTYPLEPKLIPTAQASSFRLLYLRIIRDVPSTAVIFSKSLLLLCYYHHHYYIGCHFLLHPRHASQSTDFLRLPPGGSDHSPYHPRQERIIFCPKLTEPSVDQNHRRPNHRGCTVVYI
jgi:hypothetical protein